VNPLATFPRGSVGLVQTQSLEGVGSVPTKKEANRAVDDAVRGYTQQTNVLYIILAIKGIWCLASGRE